MGTIRVPFKGLYKGLEFPKIRGTLFWGPCAGILGWDVNWATIKAIIRICYFGGVPYYSYSKLGYSSTV